MTKYNVQSFVKNYSTANFDLIKFDWNGKHGEAFYDKNLAFRMQVCEYLKADFSNCPNQLILDLYLELAKQAKETFGVYSNFHTFANELLERTGIIYFDEYIEGASKSMDTGIMSGKLSLSKERIDEILYYLRNKMEETQNKREVSGYEFMLERFEWLSQSNKNKNSKEIKLVENSIVNKLWQNIKNVLRKK